MKHSSWHEDGKYTLDRSNSHVCLSFSSPRPTLSSAILNGGTCLADNALFLHVRENFHGQHHAFDDPASTMDRYCREVGLTGATIGMMTSAPMSSFRSATRSEKGISVSACLTAGLSNARCAGDRAEIRDHESLARQGTINIVLVTDATMSSGTMAEAIMIVTEAKVAALTGLGEKSPISGKQITGTGTDAVAIVSGQGGKRVRYCGKHTLLGEMIGSAVIQALHESLSSPQ